MIGDKHLISNCSFPWFLIRPAAPQHGRSAECMRTGSRLTLLYTCESEVSILDDDELLWKYRQI